MVGNIFKKVFGSRNDRQLKKLWPEVHAINQRFAEYESLSGDQVQAKTDEFKQRLADGESVDDIMIEAFATVKAACKRMLGTEI